MDIITEIRTPDTDKASRFQNTFIFRRHWLSTFVELESDEDRGLLLKAFSDYLIDGSRDPEYIQELKPELLAIYKVMIKETEDSAERCMIKRKSRME